MKNVCLFALMAFGFSFTSNAQTKGDVELGINVGLNFSTANAGSYGNADFGTGFNAGFAADYFFSDRWSIKGVLVYDVKGWDNGFVTDLSSGNSYQTDYNLNYLTVPVMAGWHFGKKRNWYLNLGPYVGFLMSAKETEHKLDVKDAFKSTDFGVAYGIGVKIPVSDKMKLFIEYNEQDGFTNFFKQSENSITNSRGSFNIGINFIVK